MRQAKHLSVTLNRGPSDNNGEVHDWYSLRGNPRLTAATTDPGPLKPENSIVLGSRNDKMDTRYYDGKLDDLRIYDYTLSEEQIKEACSCSDLRQVK